MKRTLLAASCLVLLWFSVSQAQAETQGVSSGQKTDALRKEEAVDYYRQWLDQEAVYLISDEERAVFDKLTTDEEKEQFIEQFWQRRDTDSRTAINEFKEEHYRRVAYANEWFSSATPGWKTDRGRIYIIHGPPDDIERHAAGGPYIRPSSEGGGATTTYPFEKWWYRNMEGLGAVELEFVDPSSTGEYRLALNPFEKDAMKFVPGAGLTDSELSGETTKADRPYYFPGAYAKRENYFIGYENDPFRQWEKFVVSQKPVPVKYRDLKEQVDINISYSKLPFKTRLDYLSLDQDQVLVPITIETPNQDLTFKDEGGRHVARVACYGIVTSMTNQIISEFDDEVTSAFAAEQVERGRRQSSTYQKVLPLSRKTRYKLDLIVKDLNSGKIGVITQAIVPPAFDSGKLLASSLIVADMILPLKEAADYTQMFIVGDVKVRPRVSRVFRRGSPVGLYLQVYNLAIDQATHTPALRVAYRVFSAGKQVREFLEESGESLQYSSPKRAVLIKGLPVGDLNPGAYTVRVEVKDLITAQVVTAEDRFEIQADGK